MAHNLNFNNGKYSFAKKGELAWHKLGTYVPTAMTTEEAIKLANLDWEVDLIPLCSNMDNEIICFNDNKGVIRKDNNIPLGIVGNKYKPLQNKEAFSFFDDLIGSGEAIIETAGALGKGETIFITAKFPAFITVKDEDIDNYFLLTHAHDGSAAITIRFTSVCVVCNNTLNMAINGINPKISVKHTKNAKSNLLSGANILGIKNQFENDLKSVTEQLTSVKIDDRYAANYFQDVFYFNEPLTPAKKIVLEHLFNNYKTGLGSDLDARKNTAWGLVNAVTGYYQNIKQYKEDSHFISLLKGSSEKIRNRALNKAYELIN